MGRRRVAALDETVLDVPVAAAWRVLADLPAYPQWWPRSVRVEVLHVEPGLVGSRIAVRPLRGRGFECEIERVDAGRELRLRYVAGLYRGTGTWTLAAEGTGTRVAYGIDLEIVDRLVWLLSFVLDVAGIHSRLMQEVFAGLARRAGAIGSDLPDTTFRPRPLDAGGSGPHH